MNDAIKVLDHGYVSLIDVWGSDERIIESARMSTQKGFEGWGPVCPNDRAHALAGEHPDPDVDALVCVTCGPVKRTPGDEKLLRYLWTHDHATPFEMAGVTLEVQAPIFVFREWHRHRVPFGYNEASARYAPLPDLNYIPTVERLMMGGGHLTKQAGAHGDKVLTVESAEAFRGVLANHYEDLEHSYRLALNEGVPKELARILLPVGRYSKMRATANLRGWLGLLRLRLPKTAQWEFRQYAEAVRTFLRPAFPRSLALFDEGMR